MKRIQLAGEEMELHPHAALWWPERSILMLADVHLGKATHFRRHGLAVPSYVQDQTMDALMGLLWEYRPQELIMLGDLFHSDYNDEWEALGSLLSGFPDTESMLVPGNHDRLSDHAYRRIGIHTSVGALVRGPFILSHEPMDEAALKTLDGKAGGPVYNLAGHIHPAAKLRGKSGALRLPCFWFAEKQGLLPAFGAFTGMHTISARRGDRVYVLAGDGVVEARA